MAKAWRGQALGIAPAEWLKLRRQIAAAAAAGKKQSVPFSLFMEKNKLEVEEELSTVATLARAEGVRVGKMERSTAEGIADL